MESNLLFEVEELRVCKLTLFKLIIHETRPFYVK